MEFQFQYGLVTCGHQVQICHLNGPLKKIYMCKNKMVFSNFDKKNKIPMVSYSSFSNGIIKCKKEKCEDINCEILLVFGL